MGNLLLMFSIIIFACVLLDRISAKIGMPVLLAFIF
ncbi:MAG: potassium:proton antiporter, partial [Lachnospiraceae bacterium]|nr:potassium:proton antiporter [Lachnospiraceae bacterium]